MGLEPKQVADASGASETVRDAEIAWRATDDIPPGWPPWTDYVHDRVGVDWVAARVQADDIVRELARIAVPGVLEHPGETDPDAPDCASCGRPGLERVHLYRRGYDTWRCRHCLSWRQEPARYWSQ